MSDGSSHHQRRPPAAKKPAIPLPTNQFIESDDEDLVARDRRFLVFQAMPSWLASLLVNLSLILLLALFAINREQDNVISLQAGEIDSTKVEDIDLNLDDLELSATDPLETTLSEPIVEVNREPEELTIETDILTDDSTLLAADESNFDSSDLSELTPAEKSSEIGGRTGTAKQQALTKNGGNAASEEAVQLALQWIADHQLPDGGWDLDHTLGPKVNGRPRTSPDPGDRADARFGATAMAMLPFLASGHTHKNGEYRNVVLRGLQFLMANPTFPQEENAKGISYSDNGNMYSHGLVAMLFCECYAMTGDERLREFAQGTVDYIESAQAVGGGWRYGFREPGDTSVMGWQIMALKSAKLGGLEVNPQTLKLARQFLDAISIDNGAVYGYLTRAERTSSGNYYKIDRGMTAVGLLCRMYLGWQRDQPGLVHGVGWLSELGPDTSGSISAEGEVLEQQREITPYYNYHATQVMIHYGGDDWKRWNEGYTDSRGQQVIGLRDFLIDSQVKEGPAKGSWMFNPNGKWQAVGGRLYVTALSCLTLQVYYRYLPMYTDKFTDDDFSTDF